MLSACQLTASWWMWILILLNITTFSRVVCWCGLSPELWTPLITASSKQNFYKYQSDMQSNRVNVLWSFIEETWGECSKQEMELFCLKQDSFKYPKTELGQLGQMLYLICLRMTSSGFRYSTLSIPLSIWLCGASCSWKYVQIMDTFPTNA